MPQSDRARLIAFLLVALLIYRVPLAGEAKDAYRNAVALREQGLYVEAVPHFQRAAELAPKNAKYQEALELARQSAVLQLLDQAEQTHKPIEAFQSITRALELSPTDIPARQLRTELLTRAAQLQSTAEACLAKHRNNEIADCSDLAATLPKWGEHVAATEELQRAMTVELQVINGSAMLAKQPGKAFELSQLALTKEPSWLPALDLRDEALATIEARIESRLARSSEVVDLRTAVRQIADLHAEVESYPINPLLKSQIQSDTEALVRRISAGLRLNTDSETVTPDIGYLRDTIIRNLKDAGLARILPDLQYPPSPQLLNIRIEAHPVESQCNQEQVEARLAEKLVDQLPAFLRLTQDTATGHSELTRLHILDLKCQTVDLPTAGVETRSSSYKVGEQQIPNPRYMALQTDLEEINRQIDRLTVLLAAEPTNWGYSLALSLWRNRARKLLAEIQGTAPYILKPIRLQYEYDTYRHFRSVSIAANLQLASADGSIASDVFPLQETVHSEDVGIRGALWDDLEGIRNRVPIVDSLDHLRDLAYGAIAAGAQDPFSAALQQFLMRRACVSVREANAPRALSSLLALDSSGLSMDSEPQAMEALAAVFELDFLSDNRIQPMVEACQVVAPSPKAPTKDAVLSTEAEAATLSMVDNVLRSVVYIYTEGTAGSGFAIERHLILTNNHVVADEDQLTVKTAAGDLFIGTVVKVDPQRDLALLELRSADLVPLSIGTRASLRPGLDVFVLGAPHGLQGSISKGIISAVRELDSVSYIQVDASINPGNSGGPVTSADGLVLGVAALSGRKDISEGIGFAVACTEISEFLSSMERTGE